AAAKARMQRMDHAMIFIAISATFTPFGMLTLHGWVRATALALVWGLATVGIIAVVKSGGGGPGRRVAAMIGLGWLGGMLAVPVGQQLGFVALLLLASGGTMYSVGGLLFAFQWPRLWPRAFSYHEVFHGMVVLAALLHFSAVYFYLLPLDAARG
ncbi:MAG: hemolysin III family protein, partial [Dehalococcoidia bacterium]